MMRRALLWLRANLLRRRLEREMREEMADHIDRSTARLVARGMSPEEARRQATREFGNVPYLQEEGRYARGTMWLDALTADGRFALRHFARRPVTTIVMFVVLAVGMSISTLLFSFVHAYAVRPPPGVESAEDLVRIRGSRAAGAAGRGVRTFSEDEFRAYRSLTDHFAAVAGWVDVSVALIEDDDPERRVQEARVSFVTENYFSTLGVQPILGRGLPASGFDDPAAGAVAVIGHTAWNRLFARSPDAIGATVLVNGVPVTIVGIAPERFVGMTGYRPLQLWLPLAAHRMLVADAPGPFRAFGRLRPGVSREAATAAVQAVALRTAGNADDLRALEPGTDVVQLLSANGDPMFERDVRLQTFSLGLLGLLVLLVTCTNVSALLTGLATARRQEIAIRLSLGAARRRIIRQLLTESALLATIAAAGALGIVWLVLDAASRLLPELPLELGITWTATTFTFGIALAVGVVFGLSPALHATRLALALALRDSTALLAASRARLQRGLVVAQIAFTQPLIVLLAAVLLFAIDGFAPQGRSEQPERVVALTVRPTSQMTGSAVYGGEQELRVTMRRLTDRLSAAPRVEAAVLDWGGSSPLGAYVVHDDDRTAGATQDAVNLAWQPVEEGYFAILDVPVLRGREFTPSEASVVDARAPEVPTIVSAGLARRMWAGADPLGRRLRPAGDSARGAATTLIVVGVVDDPLDGLRGPFDDYRIYLPPDTSRTPLAMLVRTAVAADPGVMADIRTVAQQEAPGAVLVARTLADIEDDHRRRYRTITRSLMTAGAMALLLSALGLYAVVAFSVSQRTREIAVRIAVGAAGHQIARKFLADGLRLSAFGLALGLPISLAGLQALMGLSDDIPRVGLGSVTAIAALGVAIVATAAAWIPARRAVAVDPAVTLRSE